MYCVGVRKGFSASHILEDYRGKCSRLHGHNYIVEVEVCSDSLDALNMVIDFSELKAVLQEVIGRLDHSHLNEVLGVRNPTCEYIAKHIHMALARALHGFKSLRVRVYETPDNWCTCDG